MKRPLAVFAIALIGGIIIADVSISQTWGMVTIVLTSLALILLLRPGRQHASRFLYLAIPFLISGFVLHSVNKTYHEVVFTPWDQQSVMVTGRVLNEPEMIEGKIRFSLEVIKISPESGGQAKNARIRVTIYSDQPLDELRYGSFISLQGEIRIPEGRRNIGGFDTKRFLAAKEISGTMAVNPGALTVYQERKTFWLKSAGYKARQVILSTLQRSLPPKEASLLAGMLIGYTADMPEEMEEDFRLAGLSHILAVSGANIAFLLMPLLGLLQRLGFNRRWSSAIAFPMMLLFVFATGMEASVVRAAIMAGVTLTGMILWRKTDIYCSMAASAIIILLVNTYMLFDIGFLLSFLATLSLVVFYQPFFGRLPTAIPKGIRDTLAGTLAAQLGVIPIIAYNFNTFSLISIFSNLLVVPLTGILTLLGAILAISGSVLPWVGSILGFVTCITADLILFMTEKIARIPWAEIHLATPPILIVFLYYLVLIHLRFWHPKLPKEVAKPILAGVAAFCGVIFIFLALPSQSLRIYFADVGQGDCAIIMTPGGKNIIIDGGGSINDKEGSYTGERIVVPLLYDLNITEIDMMIASHGHLDHIGGLRTVMEKVPVHSLVIADAPDIEMRLLTDLAHEKGVTLKRASAGDVIFQEGSISITAVYPFKDTGLMPQGDSVSANELSLVLRLDYTDFSVLFTGDIGEETERRLLANGAIEGCDVLKVAHHGSKYSTTQDFLRTADPALAVIMVGKNKYGHPSPETLSRLEQEGTAVYQTLQSGGILLKAWEKENKLQLQLTR